ncbi:hypothetical protein Taro_003677 [Colocasia esculenta]|uniref:Uncharacterized protein n=1 Tax=Colocasia esculenta TaxID=4460 RepID=A0A843TPI8_COLES|nr:hypothetical protein [Colocasia esculenta]
MTGLVTMEVPVTTVNPVATTFGVAFLLRSDGRDLVTVWAAVTLQLVTQRSAPSHLGGRRLKALAGFPFPFLSLSPFPPPLRGGKLSPLRRLELGGVGGSCGARERRRGARRRRPWLREGPPWGFRLSQPVFLSRQECCRGALSRCNLGLVAVALTIAMISRRLRRARQDLVCLGCFRGHDWRVAYASGQAVPLEPSGGNAICCLHAFTDQRALVSILPGGVPVSRAAPCVPALADGPSGGFRKGCRACLCLLGLSWLRGSGAVSVVVATPVFSFAWCSELEGLSARQSSYASALLEFLCSGWWLAFQQGLSVLLLLLGARAVSVVAVSLVLRLGWFCLWTLDLVEVRGGRACGETLFLTWLFSVSRGDTWLFLLDLVEVWDVGCLCRETLVSRGCSGFRELLCLSGCVPRVCFRIVLLWPDPGCGSWHCSSCFHMCFTPLVLQESSLA